MLGSMVRAQGLAESPLHLWWRHCHSTGGSISPVHRSPHPRQSLTIYYAITYGSVLLLALPHSIMVDETRIKWRRRKAADQRSQERWRASWDFVWMSLR